MYGLLTKLLLRGNLKFKPGQILGFGIPHMLINVFVLKYLTDIAENEGVKSITDLYLAGWLGGLKITKNIIKAYNLKKFEERYKIAMDLIGVFGIGDYTTVSFKRAISAKFKVLNNPFAKLYYPSKDRLVCHFIRGAEAGGGTLVHETLINSFEFECTAVNGVYCIHKNMNPERTRKVARKILESQLDLDYALRKEKEILKQEGYKPKEFGL